MIRNIEIWNKVMAKYSDSLKNHEPIITVKYKGEQMWILNTM